MNNKNQTNSGLPLAIIGVVLLAAIVGGWWFYQNSKSQASKPKTNVNQKTDDAAALSRYASAPPGAQPSNMLGSPSAVVTVEEFADFQCPTCAVQHPKMKEIISLYGNRIKFIFRNFPLNQAHPKAYDAAVAAEAAQLQGKYWAMQDQLFTNQQKWATAPDARKLFEEYAQKIGLDVAKFQSDMLGLPAKTRVDADMQRGRALGINGTPTVFINGRQLTFEMFGVESMRQIIDAELQKATNQTQSNQSTIPSAGSTDNSAENK
ncbi:MAG: DsbA family protein [Acidobacteriota bacterium]|nr:DsbA family protein [Acidobacteriota bacterium]